MTENELPPGRRLAQMIVSLWVPQAIHAAAELGIADALRDGPLSSAAVADRLKTDLDMTERLLAALVPIGLAVRQDPGFALTDLGRCLASDAPMSVRAWARLMGGAAVWGAWGQLARCVKAGLPAHRLDGGGDDPFDGMGADPESAAVFHQSMVEMTRAVAPGIVAALEPGSATSVVDVGGGSGALLTAVLAAVPRAQGAVFDLENARASALAHFAAADVVGRARFVAGSFFDTPPPRADLLLLKSVIHDWDDAASLRILARCREAMDGRTRLAIVEPPVAENPQSEWMLRFSDLNMLVNTGGRERSEAQYRALIEQAGLRVVAVRPAERSSYRIFDTVRT